MKTIKLFQTAAVVLILSVVVGCSDQITSPSSGGKTNSMSEELLSANSYSAQLKLRPQGTITFTKANTHLKKITSINAVAVTVEEPGLDLLSAEGSGLDLLSSECNKIAIYSYPKTDHLLNCQSQGLDLNQITVKNVSSGLIDLKISLYGERVKPDPNAVD